ncbi:MAG: HAD family phosphatase [Paludibacteraceae bacterium]|nr:HAD family phosphatase [Paludibacteraceae bacterium]
MIKNLIFDWGGVLSVSQHDEAVKRFAALGVPDADNYFEEGKNWKGIFGLVEDGGISIDDFLTKVSSLCGKQVTFEQIAYAWWGFYSHLPKGMLAQLEAWKKEGYRVYMLTNNNPFMMSYIRGEEFAPEGKPFYSYFDHLYVSCDIGLAKPDPAIYQYVLDDGGMNPAETVFVDDRRQNLVGADKVGMKTYFVEDSENWIDGFNEFLKTMI